MTAQIIDGKALAREIEARARKRSEELAALPGGRRPGLAVVLVGEDPASCVYVRNKTRACERTDCPPIPIRRRSLISSAD